VRNQNLLLKWALILSGIGSLLIYPLAIVWPSGWAWHQGAPYESQYFMMIIGIYATLGVFLICASWNPEGNRTLIWFTVGRDLCTQRSWRAISQWGRAYGSPCG
jgi:hypothetical protein